MSTFPASPAQVVPEISQHERLLQKSLQDEMPSDLDLLIDLDLADCPLSSLQKLDKQPDFVIFVVNDDEMQAALRFLVPINSLQFGSFPAYFCTWPSLQLDRKSGALATVLLLQQGQSNEQGTHAAQALITAVLEHNRPRMIFALGCAYGWDAKVQKKFHVLLAEGFATYHKVREGEERVNRNAVEPSVGFKVIKSQMKSWNLRHRSDARLKVHSGIVVTGDALVDSPAFKNKVADLLKIKEEGKMDGQLAKTRVVGGEMEGAGLSAAMSFRIDEPLPWMLIKGVSDDGETKGTEQKNEKEGDRKVVEVRAGGSHQNINQRKATFAAFHFLTFALKEMVALGKMLKQMSDAQATAATTGRPVEIRPGDNLYATCAELASNVIAQNSYEAQFAAETEKVELERASALERYDHYVELQKRLEKEQDIARATRAELDRIKNSIDSQFPLPKRCDGDLRQRLDQTKKSFLEQREVYAPHTDTFLFPYSDEQWDVTLRTVSKTTWSERSLRAVLSIPEYEKARAGCQVSATTLTCDRVAAQAAQNCSHDDDEGEASAHELIPAHGSSSSGEKTPMVSNLLTVKQSDFTILKLTKMFCLSVCLFLSRSRRSDLPRRRR